MLFSKFNRKTGFILAGLFFLCCQSRAQDYIIRHDFQKNNTSFFQIGKNHDTMQVKEVGLKKPGRITLKVDNFNPFYWDAKVTVFKKPVDEESSHIGLFVSSLMKGFGASDVIQLSRSSGLTPEINNKLEMLTRKANSFSALNWELSELQKEIHQTEGEIKSEARQSFMEVFGKDTLSAKEARIMGLALDNEKKEVNAAALPVTGQTMIRYSFLDSLTRVVSLYHSIIYTDFNFVYSVNGNPDIDEIKLAVFPKTVTESFSGDTVTRYFPVQSIPGLRLRNSVGVSFSYFRDKNLSYFVYPDTTIGKGNGDLFTPVLSTFINFYIYKQAGFRWGGSFGFGVPLMGENKDVNFMLGLCTMFGRNEPIIVTAGIAGAKVDRLSRGWQVGQKVPALDFEIPTLSQFRIGGYISITFNLSNFSRKDNQE